MECPICDVLKKTCKELGDESFCDKLIEDIKQNKITEKELNDKIMEKFGEDKFKQAWDSVIDNFN